MGRLRKILRETIPELADALERSWTIALDEWLAAMSPSSDSFNSYPHLRNHEKHLERIWLAYERHHGASAPPLLSPVEIYVMLSSILFHDIGRTLTSTDHGEALRRSGPGRIGILASRPDFRLAFGLRSQIRI
jgi:hypothetical protein